MKNVLQEKDMKLAFNILPGGGGGTLDPDKPGGGDGNDGDSSGKE